jgi:flagellar protein FliJ
MTRTFHFNLQTALDIRQRKEDEARRQFAAAQRVLREAVEARNRLRTKRAEVIEQVRTARPDEMLNASRCLEFINKQLAGAHALVERQAREAELCRQGLLLASQEREALTRLRERRLDEHRREVARADQRELDDVRLQPTSSR